MKKRILIVMLILVLCLSTFAACTNEGLEEARDYVKALYRDEATITGNDFTRPTSLTVKGIEYSVAWKVTDESGNPTTVATVGEPKDGKVTISIEENLTEDSNYLLIATVSDANGKTVDVEFHHTAPYIIRTIAAALAANDGVPAKFAGTVTKVVTAWDAGYKNMSVNVSDGTNEIYVYRTKTQVVVGDEVIVNGTIGSYNGAKQIAAGSTMTITKHADVTPTPETVTTIAAALSATVGTPAKFTGTVSAITTAWSDQYNNISFDVTDGTNTINVFRAGTKVSVGDTVTIEGTVGEYNNVKQINKGATVTIVSGAGGEGGTDTPVTPVTNDGSSIEKAYTVEELWTVYGSLSSGSYSDNQVYVKGIVVKTPTYNETYKSYTFYIASTASGTQQVQGYSIQLDEGITNICVNDEVVVYGYVEKWNNTLEVTFKDDVNAKIVKRTIGTSTISYTENENATITLSATSGLNDSEFTFTVVANNGANISKVYVNGTVVTALTDGSYKAVVNGNTVVSVDALIPVSGEQTVTVDLKTNFGTYAKDWTSSYNAKTLTSTDLGVKNVSMSLVLSNANKQDSTAKISDMPVMASKGGNQYVTISIDTLKIKSVTFNLKEWAESKKFVTVAIEYTTDGTTWTAVDGVGQVNGTAAPISKIGTELTANNLPEGVTGVRLVIYATGSSNVQVGIEGFTIVAE